VDEKRDHHARRSRPARAAVTVGIVPAWYGTGLPVRTSGIFSDPDEGALVGPPGGWLESANGGHRQGSAAANRCRAALFSALGVPPSQARSAAPSYVEKCGSRTSPPGRGRAATRSPTAAPSRRSWCRPPLAGPDHRRRRAGLRGGRAPIPGARVTGTFSILSGTPLFIAVAVTASTTATTAGSTAAAGRRTCGSACPTCSTASWSPAAAAGRRAADLRPAAGPVALRRRQGRRRRPARLGRWRPAGRHDRGGEGGGQHPAQGGPGRLGWGGGGADPGGGGWRRRLLRGGGGGGCAGGDGANHLCVESQPGSGGGGSSLVPAGGTFGLSNTLEPSITITLTQYG